MPSQGQRRKKSSSSLPQTALHRQMSCSAGCENVSEAKARPGRKRPEVDQSVLIDATEQVANAETHLGAGTNACHQPSSIATGPGHSRRPSGQNIIDLPAGRQQEPRRAHLVLVPGPGDTGPPLGNMPAPPPPPTPPSWPPFPTQPGFPGSSSVPFSYWLWVVGWEF